MHVYRTYTVYLWANDDISVSDRILYLSDDFTDFIPVLTNVV